jgi:uncharacterized damage-inducible protein DinB
MRHWVQLVFATIAVLACRNEPDPPTPDADESVRAVRGYYNRAHTQLVRVAEKMPEADYGFRPTAEVRAFGEIIGHVADAEFLICGPVLGERKRSNVEKTVKSKPALVQALNDAGAYCARAFALSGMDIRETVETYGMKMTKLEALIFVTTHDFNHYGNLVTYLRLKGLAP